MKALLIATCAALLGASAGMAETEKSEMNHSKMDHSKMDHSSMTMSAEQMEGAVHTMATLNSIGDGTANVSHEPIPEIGWPAMTMDLPVLPEAHMMGDASAGDSVTLMLIKGEDGMYAIGGIMAE
ncbi:Cu(I)/Ag(I) efflux system protein CusF [Roseovarius nanhaiticus]|uniref:Cu(I)/Ag(I) efflux system protein CusF n=1 Tax=Roseovarius nanhaiticus TaxID=573024 RepID=A0A1N7HC19_9RHOB|nr:copper-binding protein [Roseovarius nanhaiticus]SEL04283.1 Cu(I)/Ag(I) efflux system protein CusF [Roseovarius nanhaiticus]SIS22238.1 Cu(I)/Ag(I) efflux system protein CusF [Roseovarius nanhaiticus]